MEDYVSLDDWRPSEKSAGIVKSQWRQQSISKNYNDEPGLDELRKIKMYLKHKKKDHEIMEAFGIDCKTLHAIKNDRYSPTEGISLDNLSKIYLSFDAINKKIHNIFNALNMLADNAFESNDLAKRLAFKTLIKIPKKKDVTEEVEEKDEEDDIF